MPLAFPAKLPSSYDKIWGLFEREVEKLLALRGRQQRAGVEELMQALEALRASKAKAAEADLGLLASSILAALTCGSWDTLHPRPDLAVPKAVLPRVVPVLFAAFGESPDHVVLRSDWPAAATLGRKAIPWLVDLFDTLLGRAMATPPEYRNPTQCTAARLAETAFDFLLQYEGADLERAARLLASLAWDADRLWLFRKILRDHEARTSRLAKIFGPKYKPVRLAKETAARVVLGEIDAATKGTLKKRQEVRLPRRLPVDVAGALRLMDELKLGRELERGAPARQGELAKLERSLRSPLPSELRELLSVHASIGSGQLGPIARMISERRQFLTTVREDERDSEGERLRFARGEVDVRHFRPREQCIVLGTDLSGDQFLLAPPAKARATRRVIRYRHDDPLAARVEARSLGEFVALLATRAFADREGLSREFEERFGPPS